MEIMTASREYANRPKDECFPSLEALVSHSEDVRSHSFEKTYSLKDLRFVPAALDGAQHLPNDDAENHTLRLASPKGTAALTHWAFGQTCRMLQAPASYVRTLDPRIAADALNYGISRSPAGTRAQLLIKMPNGQPMPIVRSCTSDHYSRLWDAELYGAVAQTLQRKDARWQLPPTWSGEPRGAYSGDRDSFLILCNGGSIVTDPSRRNDTGDGAAMYRALLVRNSEVGAAAVTIEQILYRFICGNHILWGATIDKTYRRRHVGDNVRYDSIREIADLAWKWTERSASQDEQIIRALIDNEIAVTKDAVLDQLRSFGATREQAAEAYSTCEQTENASPRSYWGIAQGLTRNSQRSGYQDERLDLDRLAATVMQRGRKLVTA